MLELLRSLDDQLAGRGRVRLRGGQLERQQGGDEPLLGAVVEVALELAPSIVGGFHDARAQAWISALRICSASRRSANSCAS